MKSSTMTSLALATLFHVAMANFDLYMVNERAGSNGPGAEDWGMWHIWESEPTCDQVTNDAMNFLGSTDVSGNKIGVRCESEDPLQCATPKLGGPEHLTVIEMNFADGDPQYHWTIYKDRNYDMIGLDGNVHGHCYMYPGHGYDCSTSPTNAQTGFLGERKFRCETKITVADIRKTWGPDKLRFRIRGREVSE